MQQQLQQQLQQLLQQQCTGNCCCCNSSGKNSSRSSSCNGNSCCVSSGRYSSHSSSCNGNSSSDSSTRGTEEVAEPRTTTSSRLSQAFTRPSQSTIARLEDCAAVTPTGEVSGQLIVSARKCRVTASILRGTTRAYISRVSIDGESLSSRMARRTRFHAPEIRLLWPGPESTPR